MLKCQTYLRLVTLAPVVRIWPRVMQASYALGSDYLQ